MIQEIYLRNGSMGLRGVPSAIAYCPTESLDGAGFDT